MDTTSLKGTKRLKRRRNKGLRIAESTWQVAEGSYFAFCSSVLSPEGKDQVGGQREQSMHRREVSRSSTMSPNDPEHGKVEAIVRTNLTEPPQKKAKGISINEGGSNPPKRREDELQPGDKGKRKKHIARKGAAIEPYFSEPEEAQPLFNRKDALLASSQSTNTSTPSAATHLTTDSVPAQAPPVTPALPIVPPPRLLNKLKGDGLRTIIEEKVLSMEGLEGKHPDVLETL
uniref:Integrase core domain containing protein n=1 Tax=Solanum tuberosum TaxID=4113 RepID=M1DIP2_SOLTU